jgi:hypothetical protein
MYYLATAALGDKKEEGTISEDQSPHACHRIAGEFEIIQLHAARK